MAFSSTAAPTSEDSVRSSGALATTTVVSSMASRERHDIRARISRGRQRRRPISRIINRTVTRSSIRSDNHRLRLIILPPHAAGVQAVGDVSGADAANRHYGVLSSGLSGSLDAPAT
jgi:hypothetical protein